MPKIGDRYGLLTVIETKVRIQFKDGTRLGCKLLCDCGGTRVAKNAILARTHSNKPKHCGQQCGLRWLANEKGIGSTSPSGWPGWYKSYNAMKRRCYDENQRCYPDWGGRGIKVCNRWLDDPLAFYADMGDRPVGLSIERINNNGNYEPSNCKWASTLEQAQNKRPRKPKSARNIKNLASNRIGVQL